MGILSDFKYALRTLRQSPGFALTAIAVLALGIGANTAIFSVVYSVILRPLPYPDASRLVFVWQHFRGMPAPFGDHMMVARQNYREWQRQNVVFEEMAAFNTKPLDEIVHGYRTKVVTTFTSASLFRLLGATPRLGRLFRPDEERVDHDRVAILSDRYFDRRFHRDPKALGKSITVDETTYTVIGVLPASFYLPRTLITDRQPDVLVPLPDDTTHSNKLLGLVVAARLRPGVSLTQARTEMAGIATRLQNLERKDAEPYKLGSASVFPFSAENSDPSLNRALYLLMTAVALVLLIACANLANLTLARTTLRWREITVRLALGATRGRILAHLLSESLLVAVTGATCGLVLACWSIRLIQALKPPDILSPERIAIDIPVLIFAAGTAGLTTILFGLAPALAVSGADISSRLKAGGGWGSSAARLRSRQFLIAIEVALALMLLSGAGLMIRSLQQVALVGLGFDTSRLAALDIDFSKKRYPDAVTRVRLISELIAHAQAIPGVADAAVISELPLHSVAMAAFHIPGRAEPTRDAAPVTDIAEVSPRFFQVIGLRLEAGRWLTGSDLAESGSGIHVALVNRAFARKYFPGEKPLGATLLSGDRKENFEIVGVVADYRATGAENEARPEIFRPSLKFNSGTLVVRSRGVPQSIEQSLLDAARAVAPDISADKVKTVDEYANYWTSQRKFNTLLLEMFAGLALVLAMLGIYGVLSNLVTSRTREIGIRVAIGATPGAIRNLLVRQAGLPIGLGILAGLGGCFAFGRLIQSLLFQVPARDPLTIGAAVTAVLITSPVALWLPLRRATAIECTVALREE